MILLLTNQRIRTRAIHTHFGSNHAILGGWGGCVETHVAVNLKKSIGISREGHDDSNKSPVLSGYRLFQVLYVKFLVCCMSDS
jgi:hypothetical protein